MSFFGINSPIYRFLQKMMDLFVLSLLWLLCSLPIVTIGAATTAAYYVGLKLVVNEETYVSKMFFKAFRANFRQGILLGILSLCFGYVLWVNYNYCFYIAAKRPTGMIVCTILGTVIYVFSMLYAYALTARYENTIFHMIRNSFLLSVRYIFRTAIILVMMAAVVAIGLWNITTIFLFLLFGPGAIIYISSAYILKIFHKTEEKEREKVVEK